MTKKYDEDIEALLILLNENDTKGRTYSRKKGEHKITVQYPGKTRYYPEKIIRRYLKKPPYPKGWWDQHRRDMLAIRKMMKYY